jgi:hypothetical protein
MWLLINQSPQHQHHDGWQLISATPTPTTYLLLVFCVC